MIDPKYAELPGIAYDQPDLYETEDYAENKPYTNYNQEDENTVEKIYISASDAFNKFKDKRMGDNDSCKLRTGYKDGNNVGSVHENIDESPFQKYQRIKSEIQEFLSQVDSIKGSLGENEESKSLVEIINEIEKAGKDLDSMNINNFFESNGSSILSKYEEIHFKELLSQIELFKRRKSSEKKVAVTDRNLHVTESLEEGSLKYKMIYYPDKTKIQELSKLSHLEKRIGCIENFIGCSGNSTAKCSQVIKLQGIIRTIEKLMANTCLLNSAQLDIFENKVISLLNKMDTAVQKKNATLPDSKYENNILELYDIVKKSEIHFQILPQIIDRLMSLNRLHQKAADFAEQLKELQNLQQTIDGSMLHNKLLLEEIQKNFSNNLEIITRDIITLKDHIKQLKV